MSPITVGKVPFINGGLRLQYVQDAMANPPLGPDTAPAVIAEIAYGVLTEAGLYKVSVNKSALLDRCFTRAVAVAWAAFDDETVLFDLRTGERFTLNRSGCFLWQRLDGKHTLGEIAEELHSWFGASYSQAQTDVLMLVEHMFRQQLVSCLGDFEGTVPKESDL